MTTDVTSSTAELPATPGRDAALAAPPESRRARLRQVLFSARTRILLWYVALIALALAASTLGVRQLLLVRLEERVDAELRQEVQELHTLANGRDPRTGAPFNSVERLFLLFLQRNVPSANETMLTFANGEPFRVSSQPPPYDLFAEPEIRALSGVRSPTRAAVDTPVGRVDYLATPVVYRSSEDRRPVSRGVFVVALFTDLQRREVDEVVRLATVVGLGTLLLASVVAWAVAGRILAPVRLVTDTARRISDTDLSGRIAVEGSDEISRLGATFNAMLDRLQVAFAAQRNFIDDAGHELRTPITIIRGHLELLGDDPAERQDTIAIVTDELDRMNRMVNDLLVLAKAGRPDFLDLQVVDLAALTDDLLAKAQALGERDWRLDARAAGTVVADRQRLTQALMQLAQNAVEHTGEGDVIALGSHLDGTAARLWVRDTGPGVAPEERDRIFDRFARASASRRRSDGAGLGLSIVRAIAEAHRGRVELDSRPGEGATFSVVIPVDPPHLEEA